MRQANRGSQYNLLVSVLIKFLENSEAQESLKANKLTTPRFQGHLAFVAMMEDEKHRKLELLMFWREAGSACAYISWASAVSA